ncbi:Predicted phosphoesterase [Palleronia marisminoris]|uniref:Calcineurin-like phosphoesterase superfamily domain protein n=1 Tax=Palleronia marisminoris TaxID=315423 RepID=A0A1Y5SVI2_9RHOB|nr:metallophosphoesterase [Palleronia marisminoris]SFG96898.1 Predicted phosphoesterase [Palleronia marisminoris]SLN47490.1 Calcineurin-like phosphoesterase superfamily domain protein [Palleronia marisminoris]
MKILAVSDLHLSASAAEALLSAAGGADLVLAAGDFANQHEALAPYMARLAPIADKMICVPGNNESLEALQDATRAEILHGTTTTRGGLIIAGLGGGVPPLPPLPWHSWDLSEDEARDMLAPIEHADILMLHSPPAGLGDNHDALGHLGSVALKEAMLRLEPRLCVFGHIHDCWGQAGTLGATEWRNLGPDPVWFDL